jgi:hypothetical protein
MKRLQIANGIILALASLMSAAGVAQADVAAGGERKAQAGGVTVTKRVFRLIRFDGGRVLQVTGLDGAEYEIVLTSQAQVVPVTRPGGFSLSKLRAGDRLIVDGAVRDGILRANRLEARGGLHGERIAATGIDPR